MTLALVPAQLAAAQECASPSPDWVFCDDFESSADQDGALGLWEDQGLGPQNLVIEEDPSIVHGGQRALRITAHKGQDTGGGPTKWFLPGYDEVYVRFWTRFAADYHYLHHMVFIGASQASNMWSAFGTAGCRPSGSNFFVTQVEPFSENGDHAPPGAWGFYTYSTDMQCDTGSNCANYADPQQICNDCATKGSPCSNGLECCWGTNNIADPAVASPLGRWTCVEARVQANTGGQANGSQTLFIDGVMVGEWSGIRFRTDDALKLNSLGLWHYVTDDVYAAGQTEQTLWFDDVVVSTAPIGCGGSESVDAGTPDSGSSTPADAGETSTPGSSGGASGGTAGPARPSAGGGAPSGASGSAASSDDASTDGGSGSGCGCRTTGSRSHGLGAASVLMVLSARRRSARVAARRSR
jgi:hypothetical protein